jgi:hypothetical protein
MNDGISWEAAGCSNSVMALLLVDCIACRRCTVDHWFEANWGTRGEVSVDTPLSDPG